MALEMLAHFNTWCIKCIRNTKSGPEKKKKKMRALNILIPGAKMALEIVGLFQLLIS